MSTSIRSVATAMAEVATWVGEQEQRQQAETVKVDGQISEIQGQLAALQEQLGSLQALRTELEAVDPSVGRVAKTYDAIFGALESQSTALKSRAAELSAAEADRTARVLAELPTSTVAAQATEYAQFKSQVEPTLAGMPASFRDVVVQHSIGLQHTLQSWLAEQLSEPVEFKAEQLELDMVVGFDAPKGKPELLVIVLPMDAKTMTRWADRDEDLQTLLAARVVQAIYETTKSHGPAGAQAVCGGHRGLLAVEVDLLGAAAGFESALTDTLHAVLVSAPELATARVRIVPRQVELDLLLPPEPAEEVV